MVFRLSAQGLGAGFGIQVSGVLQVSPAINQAFLFSDNVIQLGQLALEFLLDDLGVLSGRDDADVERLRHILPAILVEVIVTRHEMQRDIGAMAQAQNAGDKFVGVVNPRGVGIPLGQFNLAILKLLFRANLPGGPAQAKIIKTQVILSKDRDFKCSISNDRLGPHHGIIPARVPVSPIRLWLLVRHQLNLTRPLVVLVVGQLKLILPASHLQLGLVGVPQRQSHGVDALGVTRGNREELVVPRLDFQCRRLKGEAQRLHVVQHLGGHHARGQSQLPGLQGEIRG